MKIGSQHIVQFDWFGAVADSAFWTYQRADGQYLKADELTFQPAEHRFEDLAYDAGTLTWRRAALFTIPNQAGAVKVRGHHLDAGGLPDKGTIDRDYYVTARDEDDLESEASAAARAAADLAAQGATLTAVGTRESEAAALGRATADLAAQAATQATIAALNNLSAAQVWAYVTRTLTSAAAVLDAQGYTAARATLLDALVRLDVATSTLETETSAAARAAASAAAEVATQAAIAALNNLSAGQVLTQVGAGLIAYDATTQADLNVAQASILAAIAAIPSAPSAGTIAAAVWANATRTLTAFGFTVQLSANGLQLVVPRDPISFPDMMSAFDKMFMGLMNRFYGDVLHDLLTHTETVKNQSGVLIATMPFSATPDQQEKGQAS